MKILVTGATHGMGKGVAKILGNIDQQSHEVIILGRSNELGNSVVNEIVATTGNHKVSFIPCDLSKLNDVKQAIKIIQNSHDYLDGLFINAGIGYAKQHEITEDGLDAHFQVNYLSQFILTLNLLNLLENSKKGGRVIFNTPSFGEMVWDDLQMEKSWHYEKAIGQSIVAKRMFLYKLHQLYCNHPNANLSFVGFSISKTVWSNQLNLIPPAMRVMPAILKLFGFFISIEKCGEIMAPLFTEETSDSLQKSGKLITWKNNAFIQMQEKAIYMDPKMQDKLWEISLNLCDDDKTREIAKSLEKYFLQ
jgi:hypothetical protein